MSRLPPTFTSLYRLFLRTVSASVLHHGLATRNLRQLWRPTFVDAAQVVKKLEKGQGNRAELEKWLNVWEKRVDNTLHILYNSATSRGLAHNLTRNLSFIIFGEYQRFRDETYQLPAWNPRLAPNAPEYQLPKPNHKDEKKRQLKEFDDNAWKALGQVVRMAEGRDGITLGSIMVKGKNRRRVAWELK